jgi:dinuclear metal center YbgI/SA1388 family protein
MKIADVITFLESLAHPSLQEHYDNAGLLTGDSSWECKGILCTLDATEMVVKEAIEKKCNLIIAHHPIIFGGLKKINGKNYVEKTVITAIKNDIAIYAIHTNLDNVIGGVSGKMAELLGLKNVTTLLPKPGSLKKLYTFAPIDKAEQVRNAIFAAGGGFIGNYSEASFNVQGEGTFKAEPGAHPYTGEIGKRHFENEIRIEVIIPAYLEQKIVSAMKHAHPYEEVAFDVIELSNTNERVGAGAVGDLEQPMTEKEFLSRLKDVFRLKMIRHTALSDREVKRVALCGGAGSFLIPKALAAGAEAYVTADMKYHEFFDANDRLLIADIGHYESEQHTSGLLKEVLEQKFPTFAVLKTAVNTNPVHYFG